MAIKRILRYLKGTFNFVLMYNEHSSSVCIGYADADWAGDIEDRKSGMCSCLEGLLSVGWRSSKQSSVALSTAEAEYVPLSAAAQEAIWLQQN